MPVSGNEQPRVIAQHSSISSAGVPIKKRRFPTWNTSSPPREQDSLFENRQSSPSQDSSLLNSSLLTTSGKSDASKNHFLDVKKEKLPDSESSSFSSVQENLKAQVLVQEPNINFSLGTVDNADSKENVIMALKPGQENILSHVKLHSAPKGTPVDVGKVLPVIQNTAGSIELELSAISKNSGLSLGQKEPLVSSLSGPMTPGTQKFPDFDAASLSLSLGKEKCVTRCESDVDLQSGDSLVHSNRFNWDLNTTMDAWEGSVDKSAIPETVVFDGLTKNAVIHGIKPSMDLLGIDDAKSKLILETREQSSNLPVSSSSSQNHKSKDSLFLSLSNSFNQSNIRGKHSGLSNSVASSPSIISNAQSLGLLTSGGNECAVGQTVVKSEPCDEISKHEQVVFKDKPVGLLEPGNAKAELAVRRNIEASSMLDMNPKKAVVPKSVKPEPILDGNRETRETVESISQNSVGRIIQQENLLAVKACPQTKNHSTSVGLNSESFCAVQKEPQMDIDIPPVKCQSVDQFDLGSNSVHDETKELNLDAGVSNSCAPKNMSDDNERCKLKIINEVPQDPRCERSGSDDEKINISNDMLEEDLYGSDCESDGNEAQAATTFTDQKKHGKDDEFEDGEVRDSLALAAAEDSRSDDKETKNVILAEFVSEVSNSHGYAGESNITSASAVEKDIKTDTYDDVDDSHIKESVDSVLNMKPDQTEDGSTYVQESSTGNPAVAVSDEKGPAMADHPLDQSEINDVKQGGDQELSSADALTGGQIGENIVIQPVDFNTIENDASGNCDSTLPTAGASVDSKDASKDSNSGGNRSRIINLPRGSTYVKSPYKTRPFSDGSFGRERYVDFEGEKFHQRRNRDEFYNDGPRRFFRDRIQGQSFRNFRQNYGRGRGRAYGRSDSHPEWDSGRTFISESYNDGPADFRFPRHKRNPVVGVDELECNGYSRAPDGDLVGSDRGRKPVSDELPSFRHPSSRKLSPGVRNESATRGIQAIRRIPRNFSPNKCAGEDDSDMVEIRHGGNFMRGMPDDTRDPVFTRPQPPYEHFSSGQRRGRIRSKSPERSRTRSPNLWSSPRRSPEGFNGGTEFSHRGSPVLYRMGRMRSPERTCFPDEMVSRRRESPPFITRNNDMRSVIPNRAAPPDRLLPRNTRRFEVEGRERTENDKYNGRGGGPLRSRRFPDRAGDSSAGDTRQNFGERRGGIVRNFRPGGGSDGENNFRRHIEEGGPARPFRLCPEQDSELVERHHLRDREFDRRIKNRSGIAPRRHRNIEDEDGGTYRQVWDNDGFDEGSNVKRRRF